MSTLLLDADVINIAEKAAERGQLGRIGFLTTDDCADFREAVRSAAPKQVVHIGVGSGQLQHIECIGELPCGARVFQDHGAPWDN
nr:hypothetical protein [uncultured Mediterranean phage uvMED]